MKKKLIIRILIAPVVMLIFSTCSKIEPLPDIAQPVVKRYLEKDTFVVGDTTINTGPQRDFEQDSKVIFKLTVTSTSNLEKLFVTTTSDAVSDLSRVLRTVPADAIDASGNFIKKLKEVEVYYAFHIHELVPTLSSPSITFNFQNDKDYIGTSSQIIKVIKKGSTDGKPLTYINLSWAERNKIGIGSQCGLDNVAGWRGGNQVNTVRGPFFSLNRKQDIWKSVDAITIADEIDICGYIPQTTRTNDAGIIGKEWYLVSPSDTTILGNTYAGALVTQIRMVAGAAGNQVQITVNGVTTTATYATNINTTCTNYVNANKAAYAAVGINLTATAADLFFSAKNDHVGFDGPPVKVVTLSGTFHGIDCMGGVPGQWTFGYRNASPQGLTVLVLMRNTVRAMAKKLESEGKTLRVTKYKRLDNSTGPDKITAQEFDLLTHDNEFDVLLGDVLTNGKTYGGPVGLVEVWGFVMDDGRRGLIRTSNTQEYADALSLGAAARFENVILPKNNPYNLTGHIKFQDND